MGDFIFFFLDAAAEIIDLPLGCIHGAAPGLTVAGEACQQLLQLGGGILRGPPLRLQGGHPASQLGLLLQSHIQIIADGGQVFLGLGKPLVGSLFIFQQSRPLAAELLQLVGPGQNAAALGGTAAGHGAAGVDELPVQGDNAQAVAVVFGHAHRVPQGLGHHGAAQQAGHDLLIAGIEPHQLIGHAHKARVPGGSVLHDGAPDGIYREEGGPAGIAALEHLDGTAAVLLAVNDDILGGGAQGSLNGQGTFLIGLDEVGHRAVNALDIAPLALPHDGFHRFGIALVVLFHFAEHMDAGVHAAAIHGKLGGFLPQVLHHGFPAGKLHAAAGEDVIVALGLLSQFLQLGSQALQPFPALADAVLQLPDPGLLLLDILKQTLPVLLAALPVGPEHGGLRLPLGAFRLGVGEPLAGLVRLHILLAHPLADAAGGGVQGFQLGSGLFQAQSRLLILLLHALGLGMELFQRCHPDGNLLGAQLVPQDQVALGGLRLLAQGLHLQLQLLDLVVDAEEVFLRLFQLPLRLLLPVTEAGDAGGLLKDLTPVGALVGNDLGDAALADDGITVPAQAGVHEQVVDVLEAHLLPVDVILAVAAAVILAGEHDLAAVRIENMGGVVDNQADLGKALGPPLLGAAEDHVLHLAATEGLGALFAHDPEDGVGDVGLAGAVGPHDGSDILFKGEPGFIRKGFETLYLQCF